MKTCNERRDVADALPYEGTLHGAMSLMSMDCIYTMLLYRALTVFTVMAGMQGTGLT